MKKRDLACKLTVTCAALFLSLGGVDVIADSPADLLRKRVESGSADTFPRGRIPDANKANLRDKLRGLPEASEISQEGTLVDSAAKIPDGTPIMLRLSETIDTSRHSAGHRFTGILEADIVADGSVIARKGSKAYGQLVESKQSRRLAGKSSLSFQLTGLAVGSETRPITSALNSVESARTGKSTVRKTGLGAATGEAYDRRKDKDNDHKGAKTGAAVGLGASVLSKGETVVISKGTLIEFSIGEPGSSIANTTTRMQTQQEGATRQQPGGRRNAAPSRGGRLGPRL